MNSAILDPEVQDFINRNLQDDVTRILFKKSPFKAITTKELAEQIESKYKSEKKLPTWFNSPAIFYPPKMSIEQASSEQTAKYKSTLIKGEKVIDITGGFGIDSFYFSKIAKEVVHCEHNIDLSEIAANNAAVLGATNIKFVPKDGISYLLQTKESFDTIYIDPSRRVNSQKVFKLADCEPDVITSLDMLLKKCSRILIKTSPLLDIQAGMNELKQVSEIQIISLKNDCKELLWILDKDVPAASVQLTCITLEPFKKYRFSLAEERAFKLNDFSYPLKYLYEPDVALLKAGCFKLITRDFGLKKLHVNTHLYTSDRLNPAFIGRTFRVKKKWIYKDFLSSNSVIKANIICRNFPLRVEEVKRKSKLKDGGQEYLIFATGPLEELLVLHCERL
ncbi:MAG TPA: hypothetical protein VNI52_13465 [Sphingobacteriaceae bacterium]|nr:hypothetical protein [Sphingobacteriaceae bacterium]